MIKVQLILNRVFAQDITEKEKKKASCFDPINLSLEYLYINVSPSLFRNLGIVSRPVYKFRHFKS